MSLNSVFGKLYLYVINQLIKEIATHMSFILRFSINFQQMTIIGNLIKFISKHRYVCLRVGVEALEGDGRESETSDCPLARPQGERTYH